jgi:hypothetical protein
VFANHDDTHSGIKNLSIDGFASFAISKPLTSGDELSINDFSQEDDDIDFRNHNILGLRLRAELDDKLNLTAQVVSKGIDDYSAEFDVVYAEYAITPQWHLAAGRIRTPLFMYSEYVDVGYAYQWIQAPTEIYNLVDYPFQSMESIRLRYNAIVNDWENEFIVWYGSSSDPLLTNGIDAELSLDNAWGLAFSTTYNWLTLRSVYFTGKTSADLSSVDALNLPNAQFGFADGSQSYLAGLAALEQRTARNISDDILWEKDRGEYLSVGIALNFEYIHQC